MDGTLDVTIAVLCIAVLMMVLVGAYIVKSLMESNRKLVQHVIGFQNPYAAKAYAADQEAEHDMMVEEARRRKDPALRGSRPMTVDDAVREMEEQMI